MTGFDVKLGARQFDILRELHTGAVDKEIAARLGITHGTVKVTLSKYIYPKLGVSNRVEAALWAERSGRFRGAVSETTAHTD